MTYLITSDCINCGECLIYCDVDAIVDSGQFYSIDSSKCTDCGVCPEYCPTYAIKQV